MPTGVELDFEVWVKRETDKFFDTPISDRLREMEGALANGLPLREARRIRTLLQAAIRDVESWPNRPTKGTSDFLSAFVDGYVKTKYAEVYRLMLAQLTFEALLSGGPVGYVAPHLRKTLGLRENDDLVDSVVRTFRGPLKARLDSRWTGGRSLETGEALSRDQLAEFFDLELELREAIRKVPRILSARMPRRKELREELAVTTIDWPTWLADGEKTAVVRELSKAGPPQPAVLSRRFAAAHTRLRDAKYSDSSLKQIWMKAKQAKAQMEPSTELELWGDFSL